MVILVLEGKDGADCRMLYFNAREGKEAETCGNALRCVVKFLYDTNKWTGTVTSTCMYNYKIHTKAGLVTACIQPQSGLVTVDMGCPQLLSRDVPTSLCSTEKPVINKLLEVGGKTWNVSCVNMGNPHCVVFVEDVSGVNVALLGPQFECHSAFPQCTNTEFVQVVKPGFVIARIWERGLVEESSACGSGACAVVVAGVLSGRCNHQTTVEMPGGLLDIQWSQDDGHMLMTGPATRVFGGETA